ncbi:MAG: type II toxin-antitoxin system HicA family toxin [Holophagales bacterium]|nr:type II toxin-antitoxin system HicA family toxin [Holophagales bacterium]MYC11394.1 type II toxin-antitoxin system HicA family toxin [Holophagales bacterium]
MRSKHRRTLESMRARPTPAGIRWADVVAMLQAAGVEVSERSGSRLLLKKDTERMVVHRPHPAPVLGRGTVRAIVAFLEAAGVTP